MVTTRVIFLTALAQKLIVERERRMHSPKLAAEMQDLLATGNCRRPEKVEARAAKAINYQSR